MKCQGSPHKGRSHISERGEILFAFHQTRAWSPAPAPGLELSRLLPHWRRKEGERAAPGARRHTEGPVLEPLGVSFPLPEATFKEECGALMSLLVAQALCSLPASLLTSFHNQIPGVLLEAAGALQCWDKYLMRGGHYQPAAWGGEQLLPKGRNGFSCHFSIFFIWAFPLKFQGN